MSQLELEEKREIYLFLLIFSFALPNKKGYVVS
jgi:hypothetical protein